MSTVRWKIGMTVVAPSGMQVTVGPLIVDTQDALQEKHGWRLVRPADDDRGAWQLFMPDGPLPDTGPKQLAVGQVWAIRTTIKEGKIVRIDGMGRNGDGDKIATLCGEAWSGPLMVDGCIKRAVLLFDAPASAQPAEPFERRSAPGWSRALFAQAFVGPGVVDLLKPIAPAYPVVRCGHCPHVVHVGPCPGSSPSGEWRCPCGAVKAVAKRTLAVGTYRDDGTRAWSFKSSPYEINMWSDAQAPTGMTGTLLAREKPPRRELPKIRDICRAGASMDGTE